MLSPEIKAKLGLNASEFEEKLREASSRSRSFASEVSKDMASAKNVFSDLAKESGLGGVTKALAGGTIAATAFGASLIGAVKKGIDAFEGDEIDAMRISTLLKGNKEATKEAGKAWQEFWEAQAGAGATGEQLTEGFLSLVEATDGSEKACKKAADRIILFSRIAADGKESVEGLADSFVRASAGGLDAGEAASKLLKAIKPLVPEVQKLIAADIESEKHTIETGRLAGKDSAGNITSTRLFPNEIQEHKEYLEKLKVMTPADYVKSGKLNTAAFDKALYSMAGRSAENGGVDGKYAYAREDRAETIRGKKEELSAGLEHSYGQFGEGISPVVKEALDFLNAHMAETAEQAQNLGEALGGMAKGIKDTVGPILQLRDKTADGVGKSKAIGGLEKGGAQLDDFILGNIGRMIRGETGHPFGADPNAVNTGPTEGEKTGNEILSQIKAGIDDFNVLTRQVFEGS